MGITRAVSEVDAAAPLSRLTVPCQKYEAEWSWPRSPLWTMGVIPVHTLGPEEVQRHRHTELWQCPPEAQRPHSKWRRPHGDLPEERPTIPSHRHIASAGRINTYRCLLRSNRFRAWNEPGQGGRGGDALSHHMQRYRDHRRLTPAHLPPSPPKSTTYSIRHYKYVSDDLCVGKLL
ncbi:Hypothetical predicted protein [Pelobates cultripes]|uniref:Uncharacterized protein n=1 Tax=Pelobates cultripes TaxID=61616 RepID=A0AAD1RHQ2_PELCU|nr:Hypothetical predicted protein [Pelobates cultripes]